MFKNFKTEKYKKKSILKNALVKKLVEAAKKQMPLFPEVADEIFPKKAPIVMVNLEGHEKFYTVNDKPVLVELGYGQVFPHLSIAMKYQGLLRTIIVDWEAGKALLRNADLMARGAFGVDEDFKKGQIVQIVLLGESTPLAIGILEMDGEEIMKKPDGIAVTLLHTIKDPFWLAGL